MTRHNSDSYGTTDDRTTTTNSSPTIPDSVGITRTDPGASAGRVALAGHNTVTRVWQDLIEDPKVREYLIAAARKAVVGLDRDEAEELLDSLRITDTPLMHHYPTDLLLDLRWETAEAKESRWKLCEIVPELGTGSSTVEDIISIGRLFQFVHYQNPHLSIDTETLTITVKIEYEKFKERSQSQRTNVCRLLHVLSKAFDIRLAVSQNTQAFLKQFHREDLPCVSEWSITQRGFTDTDEALVKLDPHGTSAKILRALDQEPDGTASYSELYEFMEKSDSRVRQCISELKEYGLISSFGSQNNKKVTLLEAGAEVLTSLQQRSGQRSLPYTSPSATPNPERHKRECAGAVRWSAEDSATEINRGEGGGATGAAHPPPPPIVWGE
jgi:DNA-binding MarR family transcriptional regulator